MKAAGMGREQEGIGTGMGREGVGRKNRHLIRTRCLKIHCLVVTAECILLFQKIFFRI